MPAYLQYHNCVANGLPVTTPLLQETRLSIRTSRSDVQNTIGSDVFVIAGLGKPRQFYLWETFVVDEVHRHRHQGTEEFVAIGSGWQLWPPQRLQGARFDEFRQACCNFVSFRRIDTMTYHQQLATLAEQFQPSATRTSLAPFLEEILHFLPRHDGDRELILDAMSEATPMRALSIRQPHAEAILRGIKPIEYRSTPTRTRGRIWIYASQVRYSAEEEAEMMKEYGIKDIHCDDLPRGVLLGTVDLWKCIAGDWYIQNPQRAKRLLKPTHKPQPKWFYPFGRNF